MTTTGNIPRAELIRFCMDQADLIEVEAQRIRERMADSSIPLSAVEDLYAQSRENNGALRALRAVLEKFNANSIIGGNEGGRNANVVGAKRSRDDDDPFSN